MGLANVVPGVSGGTIALLAGIFERFVHALKSFDIEALRLLFKFKFKEFAAHTDLLFLVTVFLGEVISIFTAARLLSYLFTINNGIYVWAFFFGLILVSVYYVGKTVKKYTFLNIVLLIIGAVLAYGMSMITPASENDNIFYLIFCGALAICDMLLPGISGSYTLILLGNYKLVVIDAVSQLNFSVLLPVAVGVVIGFLAFSRFLSWLMKNYGDQTTAMLTGFVFGSLGFIWPWKIPHYAKTISEDGFELEVLNSHGEPVVEFWEKYLPDLNSGTFIAIALMVVGILTLAGIEKLAHSKGGKKSEPEPAKKVEID
jgi:putative membrane protein